MEEKTVKKDADDTTGVAVIAIVIYGLALTFFFAGIGAPVLAVFTFILIFVMSIVVCIIGAMNITPEESARLDEEEAELEKYMNSPGELEQQEGVERAAAAWYLLG